MQLTTESTQNIPKRGLGGALKESKYRQDVPIVVSLTKARPAIASALQMRDQIELNPRGSTVLWPVGIILPPHHSSRARALPSSRYCQPSSRRKNASCCDLPAPRPSPTDRRTDEMADRPEVRWGAPLVLLATYHIGCIGRGLAADACVNGVWGWITGYHPHSCGHKLASTIPLY